MADAEKLLSLFEARFQAFGKRIADFADLQSKYEDLEKNVQKLLQNHDNLVANYQKLQENINHGEISQGKFNSFVQSQIDAHSENVSKSFLNHHAKIQNMEEFSKMYASLSSKCSELEKRQEQFLSFLADHSKKHSNLKSDFEHFQKVHETFKEISIKAHEQIPNLKESFIGFEKILGVHERALHGLEASLNALSSKLDANHEILSSKIDQKVSGVSLECQEKINLVPVINTSKFIEKKELDELKHLISLNGWDAKNALSKSNIHEMQLQLLTKKIESLLIQSKSHEIAQ